MYIGIVVAKDKNIGFIAETREDIYRKVYFEYVEEQIEQLPEGRTKRELLCLAPSLFDEIVAVYFRCARHRNDYEELSIAIV